MTGRNLIKRNNLILYVFISFFSIFPKSILNLFFECSRCIPGLIGIGIRYVLVKNLAMECGDNILINQGVYLKGLSKIAFGSNISIHQMCYIDGVGGLRIGDNVSIAHSTTILSSNHGWEDVTIPIKYNKLVFNNVEIKDDVWIGCGCRILAGVVIASRSVIAAGAVVNKSTDNNSVYGGVPAKKIKSI